MARHSVRAVRLLLSCGVAALVSGCAQIETMKRHMGVTVGGASPEQAHLSDIAVPAKSRPLTHDRQAPGAFQMTGDAVWDGRPSFGKIWVAVPDAVQPERVVIRNDSTGTSVRGGMFVAPTPDDGPIRLSSGAAAALGIESDQSVSLTITALRKEAPNTDAGAAQTVQLAQISEIDPIDEAVLPLMVVTETPREIATTPPALYPVVSLDDDYIEVAQSFAADNAVQVQSELAMADITAEIQEDFVDGQAYYRVFALKEAEPDRLYGTLADIELTTGYEGSDDGTVIADLPKAAPEPVQNDTPETWVEFAAYPSVNEALAMAQRLSRRDIPAEICSGKQGLLEVHRVFAGPAGDASLDLENTSFCAGVAAADAARPAPQIRAVMSSPVVTPQTAAGNATPKVTGPVRIKVGEATGDLNIQIPDKFSQPHMVDVAGFTVTVPAFAPPELVDRIRAALSRIDHPKP